MAGLLAILLLSACGREDGGPEGKGASLRDLLARRLPAGWQVDAPASLPFSVPDPDGEGWGWVIWKSEAIPVSLRHDGRVTNAVLHVHFPLWRAEWIDPKDFPAVYRENEELRRKHEAVRSQMVIFPKDADGNLFARGGPESGLLRGLQAELAALPPFRRDLPTHHWGPLAFRVKDTRPVQLPESREVQQEQNRIYALLNEILKTYPTR